MSTPTLYDSYGFQTSTRLLNGAERCSNNRPSWPVRTEDIHKAIPAYDWRTHLSVSRRLYANNGVIKGAINDKAMFSIGRSWEPQFIGQDAAWGQLATEWLRDEWYSIGNVRGRNFDFKTALLLLSLCIDRDGEVFVLLTKTANGYPKIQIIPAHRVGQRECGETVVKAGEFAGNKINQGIITAPWGEEIGFRVLGDTAEEDKDISANDMLHLFDPEYPDQLRGLCIFSHALNDWRDADQSQYWEQLAQLIYSSLVLIEHNESGAADQSDPGTVQEMSTTGQPQMTREVFDGGATRYYRSGMGNDIKAFVADRPNDAWDNFQDRIARKALANVWPYALVWKPDGMNGVQERSAIEKARNLIRDRQDLLMPAAIRIIGWALSVVMNLGRLPRYAGADLGGQFKWTFALPPLFNIDHGRESQQERENLKMGLITLGDYLARTGSKHGGNTKSHWIEKANEAADKAEAIAEVEKARGVKIDPREVQMLNPNEPATTDEPETEDVTPVDTNADA